MSILLSIAMVMATSPMNSRLVALEPNLTFPPAGQDVVKLYSGVDAGIPFKEMIASWNVDNSENASLKIEVRAHGDGFDTKWYTIAQWALDDNAGPRASVKGQRDENGTVDTDTLDLKRLAKSVDLQLTLHTSSNGPSPKLKLLTLCFSNGEKSLEGKAGKCAAWGKTIDVPQRAQNNYPNGGVLCSATSVSMMLWHYSNQLGKPEMNKDVPEVEYHVWDPVYKGAGNWPFNTAYAGSFKGMRSYVARLGTTNDLERWIEAGYPVVCSVSFDMLRGLPLSSTESGHLVVLVGFDASGDPVINDPAFKGHVRKTYKRADFEKAWAYSRHTVYLIYPEDASIPTDTEGLWFSAH